MLGHLLSKSTYMRGLKCHKALYLNKHHNQLRDELSVQQQALFSELADEAFFGHVTPSGQIHSLIQQTKSFKSNQYD